MYLMNLCKTYKFIIINLFSEETEQSIRSLNCEQIDMN